MRNRSEVCLASMRQWLFLLPSPSCAHHHSDPTVIPPEIMSITSILPSNQNGCVFRCVIRHGFGGGGAPLRCLTSLKAYLCSENESRTHFSSSNIPPVGWCGTRTILCLVTSGNGQRKIGGCVCTGHDPAVRYWALR